MSLIDMSKAKQDVADVVAGKTLNHKMIKPDNYSDKEWEDMKRNTWFCTFTGRKFHAFDPQPEDISLQDIAHALALVNRYNGMTVFPMSVGYHSLLVAQHAKPEYQLEGLLHDASEAYIMDVPRPWKPFFTNYSVCEDLLMQVIADKFNFKYPLPEQIHVIDNKLLHTEAIQLLPGNDWADGKLAYKDMILQEKNWREIEATFIHVFNQLYWSRK